MKNAEIKESNLEKKYVTFNVYSALSSIPEIMCEWWASSGKDINSFLKDVELDTIITEEQFIDSILGKYYFSNAFMYLIKLKLPNIIATEKLYYLNNQLRKSNASKLKLDKIKLSSAIKEILETRKSIRKESILHWHKEHKEAGRLAAQRYREAHPEEVKAAKKKYRQEHKEQIRAYKLSRRDIENEQQRKRYHENIDESRKKARENYKKYRENHLEEKRLRDKRYRETHKDEIKQRRQIRMNDEEYCMKRRALRREQYKINAREILEKRKKARLDNIDTAKQQERKYGATYRSKHKEEINERNRKRYQENLELNRIKSAEKQRKYRIKKRFKEQTSPVIFSLLDALISHKEKQ